MRFNLLSASPRHRSPRPEDPVAFTSLPREGFRESDRKSESRCLAVWTSPGPAYKMLDICNCCSSRELEFDIVPIEYFETAEATRNDKLAYPIVLLSFSHGDSVHPSAESWLDSWARMNVAAGQKPLVLCCQASCGDDRANPWFDYLQRMAREMSVSVAWDTQLLVSI